MLRPLVVSTLLALAFAAPDAAAQSTQGQSRPSIKPLEIAYGRPQAPAKAKGALRLATYNAENLFDDFDDNDVNYRDHDLHDHNFCGADHPHHHHVNVNHDHNC